MAKFVFRSLAREHPEPADFLAAYVELGAYERILSLHLAANLSGTYQSASTAAAELGDGRVRTIDDPATTQADIRRIAQRYYGDESRTERAMRESFSTQHRISYRLPIGRVYAAQR